MSIDIEKLAREAGADYAEYGPRLIKGMQFYNMASLDRFAALVLEQAAKRADELDCAHRCSVGSEVGKAIRAMKPKDAA